MMVMAMCLALWAVGVAIFLLLVMMVMLHDCRPVVLVLVVQVVVALPLSPVGDNVVDRLLGRALVVGRPLAVPKQRVLQAETPLLLPFLFFFLNQNANKNHQETSCMSSI